MSLRWHGIPDTCERLGSPKFLDIGLGGLTIEHNLVREETRPLLRLLVPLGATTLRPSPIVPAGCSLLRLLILRLLLNTPRSWHFLLILHFIINFAEALGPSEATFLRTLQ